MLRTISIGGKVKCWKQEVDCAPTKLGANSTLVQKLMVEDPKSNQTTRDSIGEFSAC